MSSKKEAKIEFQLINIEILESVVQAPKEPLDDKVIFSFNITLEQRFNAQQEMFNVICNIITFPQENPDQKLGRYRSNCVFKVKDLSKYVTKTNVINLPENVLITINSVAISTTRGLMYSLNKGTFLQGAILPLIDPRQFTTDKN